MHNFGEKRWGDGLIDDIRSQTEQNTRVVGDFTKSVNVAPIVTEMCKILKNSDRSQDWIAHFDKIHDGLASSISTSLHTLQSEVVHWRRQRLQTRFFETGDNFYLGMEFNREYDSWKSNIAAELGNTQKRVVASQIDCLWYEAAFAVVKRGDVSIL